MGCTETVMSIQNVLLNSVGDRTILVRSDEDLTLSEVESAKLVHSGGRRIARRYGDNLSESNESEEQIHSSGSHLV